MIRSILIEFRRRVRSYISPSIIIVLSLLVCFVLFNLTRPSLIMAIEPKFELNKERVVMAEIRVLPPFNDLENSDILLEELLKEIEELNGVESVTYSLSDLVHANWHNNIDVIYDNCHTLNVASNFLDFFGIEMLEGSGFDKDNIHEEVIISEVYAGKRGIKELSSNRKIDFKHYGEKVEVDLAAIYKGGLNAYPSLRDGSLLRDVPILFIPIDLKSKNIIYSGLKLLFKAKQSSDPLLICEQIEEIINGKRYSDMIYSSAVLPFTQHEKLSKDEMLGSLNTTLIPFLIFILYISISLLGSMTNIMEARTHEIGVRRALGHTKSQVMLFIIAEPLMIFICNAIIAISIFWTLKDFLDMIRPEEIIIPGTVLIFIIVLLSLIYPLVKLMNTNHIDVIQSE